MPFVGQLGNAGDIVSIKMSLSRSTWYFSSDQLLVALTHPDRPISYE
jgi:hypothetical protein